MQHLHGRPAARLQAAARRAGAAAALVHQDDAPKLGVKEAPAIAADQNSVKCRSAMYKQLGPEVLRSRSGTGPGNLVACALGKSKRKAMTSVWILNYIPFEFR